MILDNICGYKLDDEQKEVVLCKNKHVLVCAGAGSGKSLTIIGKIRYLIEKQNISYQDILVISFTNDSVKSLKDKLIKYYNYDIDVLTFHKLGLKILENTNTKIDIVPDCYLNYLIDTYFNTLITNNLDWIKNILKYFKIKYKNKDTYINFMKTKEFKNFKYTIIQFINLFKTNNYNINNFYNILIKSKKKWFNKKETFILRLILDIYLYYSKDLEDNNLIDFDDMINLALNKIDKINFKYKYVIIDEYQDTSNVKFKFINKLIKKMDSNLLVVGDDFQSIYRFTGCDLDLFLNFKNYYKDSKILKITNTYRSPYELIDIAGDFIMKNKFQIKKGLKSNKHINKPITIIYTKNQKKCIKNILDKLTDEVMIIGRNNFDVKKILDNELIINDDNYIKYKNNNNINIRYLTAHKSKGLESKNVIIINMINNVYGFPSLIKDNKLIKYVNNYKNKYYLEEERRLFYVALTRSKNNVYLITIKNNESIFIKELIKMYRKKINIITYN